MSVEKFILTKESSNFTIIPNSVSQNLKDAEALGLWVYLQSQPPRWEFYKEKLRSHFNWGRDKLDQKLSILKSHNLVIPKAFRNEKGKFTEWTLHVKNGDDFIINIQNTENPYSGELSTEKAVNGSNISPEYGLPVTGFPVTGEPTAINTTYNKNKINKKSFYNSKDQKAANEKKHDWVEAKNQKPIHMVTTPSKPPTAPNYKPAPTGSLPDGSPLKEHMKKMGLIE